MDDQETTVKIKGLPQITELEYVQLKYNEALKEMLANPTKETVDAFGDANCKLYEVQDQYRIGTKLLVQFVREKWIQLQRDSFPG